MTIKERVKQIEKLQELEVPFAVRRIVGQITLWGNQIEIGKDNDFASLNETRYALEWLVNELGGKVKWQKSE